MKNSVSTNRRAQFSIERTYAAPILDLWQLWTTKTGIESWWGPEGFDVTVTSIDLRPGGELVYRMTATGSQQVAFMKQQGMPLSTECKVTYTEVSAPYRLAYKTLTDFVPDVAPYEVATIVELKTTSDGVTITVTAQAMHDDAWTERARAGYDSQMRKLDALMSGQGKIVRS
jgi:uncharacterized protein YndB with AHSA1/START domain